MNRNFERKLSEELLDSLLNRADALPEEQRELYYSTLRNAMRKAAADATVQALTPPR